MINNDECLKKFKAISAARENEGYLEWKNWVLEQIENYNGPSMQNLIKRTEIKMNLVKNEQDIKSIIKEYVPFITVLITAIGSMCFTSMTNMYNVYNSKIKEELLQEYAQIVVDSSLDMASKLMGAFLFIITVFMILILVEQQFIARNTRKKTELKIYYCELLNIFNERLEKIQTGEIDQNIGNDV